MVIGGVSWSSMALILMEDERGERVTVAVKAPLHATEEMDACGAALRGSVRLLGCRARAAGGALQGRGILGAGSVGLASGASAGSSVSLRHGAVRAACASPGRGAVGDGRRGARSGRKQVAKSWCYAPHGVEGPASGERMRPASNGNDDCDPAIRE
jgi:hypothetical protein